MPHIEFPQDGVSLWYKTNLPNDDISRIDRAKPTIILIHGIFMSSEFLLYQFDDPVLGSNYNLIAFDQLSCGNTTNPMHGQHDFWVEAALLGLAHERLKLPPCHLVVCQEIAMNVELSFAILFPEKCLSLTIFTVAEPVESVSLSHFSQFSRLSHHSAFNQSRMDR
jgi:pimeloyl-ACP methyl ester carboxylesterase